MNLTRRNLRVPKQRKTPLRSLKGYVSYEGTQDVSHPESKDLIPSHIWTAMGRLLINPPPSSHELSEGKIESNRRNLGGEPYDGKLSRAVLRAV